VPTASVRIPGCHDGYGTWLWDLVEGSFELTHRRPDEVGAAAYCARLNTSGLGGFSIWVRLPTLKELQSIV